MKKTMFILAAILLLMAPIYAQDKAAFPEHNYYADSLKTTRDTVDVSFKSDLGFTYYTITAWTDSGADTAQVFTKSPGGSTWVQHGLGDLAAGSAVTQLVLSTTAKEWVILDGEPVTIRLYSPNTTAIITRFVVAGKKGSPVY